MGDWSGPLVRVDARLLLGALAQCALVLRARRFRPHDWIMPLFLLIGVSAGWFGFIRLCSNVPSAAEAFPLGFFFALTACGLFVADAAPPRLSAAALLSLTVTFWAVYLSGGLSRVWLYPAIPMSAAALWFAWAPQAIPLPGRMALQAWSLSAAAAIAVVGLPLRVMSVMVDYRVTELAPALSLGEILITGAQVFLFAMLAAGVVLLFDQGTWRGWYPSDKDARPSGTAVIALFAQGAVLAWALRRGGQVQGQFVALSVLGALAHGAMTGDDAGGELKPVVDPGLDPRLSREDELLLMRARASALDFLARRKIPIALALAAAAAGFVWRR